MKQKYTRPLALVILLSAALVSCGETAATTDTTAPSDGETTAAVEIPRDQTPDNLPALDFGGKTVHIAYRGDDVTRLNEMVGEDSGDVVSDAVYARNLSVEERLNVKLEFIPGDSAEKAFMDNIRTVIMAADDTYDIIDSIQYCSIPLAVEGLYYNLADAPYLDYDQPWWNNGYMNEISLNTDERYLLSGDISIWQIRSLSTTFFNKRMFEDYYGSADAFYDLVLDGKWTHAKFREYIKGAYQDLNSDGRTDDADIIGAVSAMSSYTDHLVYPAGLSYTTRGKDGYPVLLTDQSRNVKVIESLYDLFYETPGMFVSPKAYTTQQIVDLFTGGTTLFYPIRMNSLDSFRDMKDPFGIIPTPKLDETQENYLALVHDSTTLYCIPVTAKSIDMPCAVIEAMCAENYRTVIPAYYEVALKVKYTRDDISAQIIDLIHDSATTDFVYANNYCFAEGGSLGTIARDLMGYYGKTPSKDFMSAYASLKGQVETSIKTLVDAAKAK